jgi:hypothetical protein
MVNEKVVPPAETPVEIKIRLEPGAPEKSATSAPK